MQYIEYSTLHLNSILMYVFCKIYMWIYFSEHVKKTHKNPHNLSVLQAIWCVQFSIERNFEYGSKKNVWMYHYEYVFDILSFDNLLKVISVTFWSLKLNTVIFRSYFLITYLKFFSLKGICMYYCSSFICAFVQYLIFAQKKLLYKKTLNYIW